MSATAAYPATNPLQLRPRLKPHVDCHRHLYRSEVWYVFHDRAVDRFYRVSGPGADLIGALDGKRTVAEICHDLLARGPDHQVDIQQAGDFLGHLNALGLLRTGLSPSAATIARKQDAIRRRKFHAGLKSPLAIRVPLFDPTWLLERLAPAGAVLFSPLAAIVWGLVVFAGLGLALAHWGELTADFSDRLLSIGNLGVIGAIYPVIKILHELSHGMALRRHGVEVRRMGVIFVAFMPMPYVDASASVVLRGKRARMLVAGAGILTELFIAGLAMLGWTLSSPGTFHLICYNALLITGLSTLLFNGNPLQRYDGYYLLCDLVEIPSLGLRSSRYIGFLARRHLLGDTRAREPAATPEERRWFLVYGILSTFYRTFLVFRIGLFVAQTYPLVGGGLALWSLAGVLWAPVAGFGNLLRGRFGVDRRRALTRLGGVLAVLMLVLFVLPLPLRLVAEGVVWLPDEGNVRAHSGGTIIQVLVDQGAQVAAGQPILMLEEPEARARLKIASAELDQLAAEKIRQSGPGRRVDAGKVDDRMLAARQRLTEAQQDVDGLILRSPVSGRILFSDYSALIGRYLPKGQAPAVIWNGDAVIVRTLLPPEEIDRLRDRLQAVRIRPGYDSDTVLSGHVTRLVPSTTEWLPSQVLAVEGGGHIAVVSAGHEAHSTDALLEVVPDPRARLASPMFEIDVVCDEPLPFPFLNGRALVRFDLGGEPLGRRMYRWLRLTFLRDLYA